VAPEADHVNETCNTLDFGSRAKGLDLGKVSSLKTRTHHQPALFKPTLSCCLVFL